MVNSIGKGSRGHRHVSSVTVSITITVERIYADDYVQSDWRAAPHPALQRIVVKITKIKRLDRRSARRCRPMGNGVSTVEYTDKVSRWIMAFLLIIYCIVVASSYPGYFPSPSLYTSEFDANHKVHGSLSLHHTDTALDFIRSRSRSDTCHFQLIMIDSPPLYGHPVESGSFFRHLFFFTLLTFAGSTNGSITAAERINLLETRPHCSIRIRRQLSFEFRHICMIHTVVLQDRATSFW